jgi:hypothetical protein
MRHASVRVALHMAMRQLMTFLFLTFPASLLFGQEPSGTAGKTHLSGAAAITNNGISLIPSFSLEQPATVLNMSLQKGRFSFDPEFSFSLQEGRPWYQLFWLRYKLVDSGRFRLTAGTHLGLNYRRTAQPPGSDPQNLIVTERYLVGELVPTYAVSNRLTLGVYYLFARGFDIGTRTPTHFVTFNANLSNLKLAGKVLLSVAPQVYFLSLYGEDGYYATSTFTLGLRDVPLSLSSTINNVITTNITAGRDFLWNVTLRYSFGRSEYVPKKFLQ